MVLNKVKPVPEMNQLYFSCWDPVAVQLPVSSVSLEPEQSPGAPGPKPNPSSDSWMLSVEREWFMGALSGGTCTDL